MKVADLMSRDPITLRPADRLERAVREMERSEFRHLPVVDDHGALVGVISQRDLAGEQDLTRRAKEIMRKDVETVAPDNDAHEAAYLMLRHRIGCLPVTDEHGKLLGIVTETDFVHLAYRLLGGRLPLDLAPQEERA